MVDLVKLDNLALDLCVRSLEAYGNKVSPAHFGMLQDVASVFGGMARGSITGRRVWTAPAGLGKTRLLVSWIKAMASLGFAYSVAVCAGRVEELEDIWQELQEGECPVPEDLIGLWHSKPDARVPPTFTPEEAKAGMYGTRRILLLTHARMQRGEEMTEWLRYQDKPRDLVVYDESLLTTDFWQCSYLTITDELRRALFSAMRRLGPGRTAEVLKGLMDTLDKEMMAQGAGAVPTPIRLPEEVTRSGKVQDEINKLISGKRGPFGRARFVELEEFLFHANNETDLRMIIAQGSDDETYATLVRPFSTVPTEELDRMIVLDASYPIRALLTLANKNMSEEAKAQGLQVKTFEETWPWIKPAGVKRYDHVTMHVMMTKRSGRQFSVDDAEFAMDIVKEIAQVAVSIPEDEPILVWTFLPFREDGAVPVDFCSNLRNALVEQMGSKAARVTIETFGKETATNAYKHIPNVVLTGCLELPEHILAAQYVAESRRLNLPVTSEDIQLLTRSEVWHRVYQGLNRGRCREAWVDEHGQTQAKPTNVWLFTRFHKFIQSELGPALPGVKWAMWTAKHIGAMTKEAQGAQEIEIILSGLPETTHSISIKALKRMSPILRDMAMQTFKRAREMVLAFNDAWVIQGRTLVRVPRPTS